MKFLTVIVLTGTLIGTAGCSSSALLKSSASVLTAPVTALSGARRDKPVAKILCLWEAAEGQGLDGLPGRGFAGQVMFFTHGDPSPMSVSGTVRIFEYTDYDPDNSDPVPAHLFTFDSGGWNAHRAEGTLGQTYNVFLPYVEKNNRHAVCALRVEFESENGRVISSPYTEVTLAARTTRKPTSALHRDIVTSSSTDRSETNDPAAADQKKPEPKLESHTIKLPRQPKRR
ncbi:MAG: hypothetical protein RIK87_13850 [Fuerstiella sp.]